MSCAIREITSPTPYQVFQRSDNDTADIAVEGAFSGSGTIEFRVDDCDWHIAGTKGDRFFGTIKDVPIGGPYTLELRISGSEKRSSSRRVPGLLVGDLWILAGQSNMDGCAKLINLESPCQNVHAFYYDEAWNIARDPLCLLSTSIDPVHWPTQDPVELENAKRWERTFREYGAGLGVRFGKDLYKATGVPVGLLMCSHGGTSLAQWDPDLKSEGGNSLYGSMLRRVKVAGGKVAGCLWYQGESDAMNETKGVGYKDNFRRLIESMRSDLDSPNLPFIYVQIGPYLWPEMSLTDGWNLVQTDQVALERDMDDIAMVSAMGSTMSDHIHIDAVSQRKLGARMALLARRLRFGETHLRLGPRPMECFVTDESGMKVMIKFDEVNGTLQPATGIRGFTLESDGKQLEIRGCVRDTNDPHSIVIALAEPVPEGTLLWYGKGLNPACNLADTKGFTVPVFGPIEL